MAIFLCVYWGVGDHLNNFFGQILTEIRCPIFINEFFCFFLLSLNEQFSYLHWSLIFQFLLPVTRLRWSPISHAELVILIHDCPSRS